MSESPRRCHRCGTLAPETWRFFCSQCGLQLGAPPPPVLSLLNELWALALGIVALLLGGLGTCVVISVGAKWTTLWGRLSIGWGVFMLFLAAAAFMGVVKVVRSPGSLMWTSSQEDDVSSEEKGQEPGRRTEQ